MVWKQLASHQYIPNDITVKNQFLVQTPSKQRRAGKEVLSNMLSENAKSFLLAKETIIKQKPSKLGKA